LISDINKGKILDWLDDNCTPNEYQLFSKFETDVSLGFKSPEHATMFKLSFGDATQ